MFVHNQLEYMFNLIVTDCAMAGHWCDTTWLQRKYSIRLCGRFLLEYIYIYKYIYVYILVALHQGQPKLLNISTTCLNTPGSFPYFSNWNRPCRLRLCFQRLFIYFKRMWYCTTIIWKVYPQVSNNIFPIFMMCATQEEG